MCSFYKYNLILDIEGCIAHPEHMKRDNVICLSTSIGDTYYLQTTSQAEVDSWIRIIHSGMYNDENMCPCVYVFMDVHIMLYMCNNIIVD